jgi:hypothetical protein
MPGFRPDNARLVHTLIVIHDFDQWTNPRGSRATSCFCNCFMPDPNLECGA